VRFALFQSAGEYVPPGSIVQPGGYLLLAFDEVDVPVGIQCLTSFEYVDLSDAVAMPFISGICTRDPENCP
jgi:hypothetical protein